MNVITYSNHKMGAPLVINATNRDAALLALFRYLDREWDVYSDLDIKAYRSLYDAAKTGDATAARKLLTKRLSYEYEYWAETAVLTPQEVANVR